MGRPGFRHLCTPRGSDRRCTHRCTHAASMPAQVRRRCLVPCGLERGPIHRSTRPPSAGRRSRQERGRAQRRAPSERTASPRSSGLPREVRPGKPGADYAIMRDRRRRRTSPIAPFGARAGRSRGTARLVAVHLVVRAGRFDELAAKSSSYSPPSRCAERG